MFSSYVRYDNFLTRCVIEVSHDARGLATGGMFHRLKTLVLILKRSFDFVGSPCSALIDLFIHINDTGTLQHEILGPHPCRTDINSHRRFGINFVFSFGHCASIEGVTSILKYRELVEFVRCLIYLVLCYLEIKTVFH